MKLTTKGNYAIAAILDLAVNSDRGHVSLKEIATRQGLSENYLRQLFMQMRQSDIVDSVRGVGGGYYLKRKASQINLLNIIEAVEGDIYVVPCLDDECSEECYRYNSCSARHVWVTLNDSIRESLESYTLQELIDDYYNDKE